MKIIRHSATKCILALVLTVFVGAVFATPDYVRMTAKGGDLFVKIEWVGDNAPSLEFEYADSPTATEWGSTYPGSRAVRLEEGKTLYFRAQSKRTALSKNYFNSYCHFVVSRLPPILHSEGVLEVEGDLLTLLSPDGVVDTMGDYAFACLFRDCDLLVKAPQLPERQPSVGAYAYMFAGCTMLGDAPVLPADSLKPSCYESLFLECSSLSNAPALPATVMTESCYKGMFEGCAMLTTPPELPAFSLAHGCYAGMFVGCSSLARAPVLPATILAEECYSTMFAGCSSLTDAPALPACGLATRCYESMFKNCESLVKPPYLPSKVLAPSCYEKMFTSCTKLRYAPPLIVTNLIEQMPVADKCYAQMFDSCYDLRRAYAGFSNYYTSSQVDDFLKSAGTRDHDQKTLYFTGEEADFRNFSRVPDLWTINRNGFATVSLPHLEHARVFVYENGMDAMPCKGLVSDVYAVEQGARMDVFIQADEGWVVVGPNAFTLPAVTGEVSAVDQIKPFPHVVKSYKAGHDVYAYIDDGQLVVTGWGPMQEFDQEVPPWFSRGDEIKSVVVAEGVTCIGVNAFRGLTSLTSASLPRTVETIGKGAFQSCVNLNEVDLSLGLVLIGSAAFADCSSLENVDLPESVVRIDDAAFTGDTKINGHARSAYAEVVTVNDGIPLEDFNRIARAMGTGAAISAGAITPAEAETVEVKDGKMTIGVVIEKTKTFDPDDWRPVKEVSIEVEATGESGFYRMKSKGL